MMLIDIEPILDAAKLAEKEYVSIDFLKGFEQVDAVPVVRGRWTQRSCFDEDENVYVCSACDEPWTLIAGTPLENNMHYCPNCGCDMRGEGNGKE